MTKRRSTGKQKGRDVKRRVLEILKSDDLDQVLDELCRLPSRQVINPLFSFLYSSDEQIKWRAVTAMGTVVANLADEDIESARMILRRLMWSLNDESGGIGWGAPEAIGEILASHEGLAREYANILTSYIREDGNFLEHEPLQRGAMWGIARLAQVRPHLIQDTRSYLIKRLDSSDVTVKGLAALTLSLLGDEEALSQLEDLSGDDTEIHLYLDRKMAVRRVSELAELALATMRK
ncbi:MAG: HEAT repeat domain-containing protein [Syntrophobacteria bacterium]